MTSRSCLRGLEHHVAAFDQVELKSAGRVLVPAVEFGPCDHTILASPDDRDAARERSSRRVAVRLEDPQVRPEGRHEEIPHLGVLEDSGGDRIVAAVHLTQQVGVGELRDGRMGPRQVGARLADAKKCRGSPSPRRRSSRATSKATIPPKLWP